MYSRCVTLTKLIPIWEICCLLITVHALLSSDGCNNNTCNNKSEIGNKVEKPSHHSSSDWTLGKTTTMQVPSAISTLFKQAKTVRPTSRAISLGRVSAVNFTGASMKDIARICPHQRMHRKVRRKCSLIEYKGGVIISIIKLTAAIKRIDKSRMRKFLLGTTIFLVYFYVKFSLFFEKRTRNIAVHYSQKYLCEAIRRTESSKYGNREQIECTWPAQSPERANRARGEWSIAKRMIDTASSSGKRPESFPKTHRKNCGTRVECMLTNALSGWTNPSNRHDTKY